METTTTNRELWLGGYEPYGVGVNELDIDKLFEHYAACGFLYPAKRERLRPVLDEVRDTWDKTTASGGDRNLHYDLSYNDPRSDGIATVSLWLSSPTRYHCQHLVSQGRSLASRHLLLAGQDQLACNGAQFCENWFRQENRYPNRIFGTAIARLGSHRCNVATRVLMGVVTSSLPTSSGRVEVDRVNSDRGGEVQRLLAQLSDPVVAAAEELDGGDIDLLGLDETYQSVGLRRYRRVYRACLGGSGQPVGVAVAYRGPLGLNFSFLENRLDLWLDPGLNEQDRREAAAALIRAAAPTYADFELPELIVACDELTVDAIDGSGARTIQRYRRAVWTREGFWDWHQHVDSFYNKIMRRDTRHAASSTTLQPQLGAKV